MDIKNLFKRLKQRIADIDAKTKAMSKDKDFASNPFAFYKDRTYVWIEKPHRKNT